MCWAKPSVKLRKYEHVSQKIKIIISKVIKALEAFLIFEIQYLGNPTLMKETEENNKYCIFLFSVNFKWGCSSPSAGLFIFHS